MHAHTIRIVAILGGLLLAAGCAGPRMDGQWTDPAYTGQTLRDASVLVSCRAPDALLARLCEDRLVAALREEGAQALLAPTPVDPAGGAPAVARAAREAGAIAALSTVVTVAGVSQAGIGPTLGIGFGRGTGNVGIGGGVSFPLGGVRTVESYASSSTVLEAATGRDLWSVRTASPGRDEAAVQVAALARATVAAMRRSGMFEQR